MKVKPQDNCPIWSTLCLIYRSAEYQVNRKKNKSTGPLSGRGVNLSGNEIEREAVNTTSDPEADNSDDDQYSDINNSVMADEENK